VSNITTKYLSAVRAIKHAKSCASVRYGGPCTCGRDTRIARGLQRAVEEASHNNDAYIEFPNPHHYAKRFSPLGRQAAGLLAFQAHAR
jgi:hypothetical protein